MAVAIAWTSGTTFTVPQNFQNNSTGLLWIWYSGGGGGNSSVSYGGAGGNGGNIYLIDGINLTLGGQYGVGVGASTGAGAGTNQSSFYVWPQQGANGANPGGAGGPSNVGGGGGGGAANPGGGGGNGGTGVGGNPGGAAGPGSSPWPSYGGAGGASGGPNSSGNNGGAYGGGGGGGGDPVNHLTTYGGVGLQGIVYLFYNTISLATISSASPYSTPYENDGVSVLLGGSFFTTVYAVQIQDSNGTVHACSFSISSDTSMVITPPALVQHAPYNPNIYIYNQVGQAGFSNIYTVYPNIPICSSVTGASYDNGSNQVNLNGEFFTTLSTVAVIGVGDLTYGYTGNPGSWWFGSDSLIGMFLPAISPRAAENFILQVYNSQGTATILVEYIPSPPTFSSISASTGDESGGYQVTITGSSFTTTTAVYFGSAICPHFTVNSDTSITVTVPAFNGVSTFGGGQVNITLYNPTSSVSGFDFTYTFSGYPALNAAHAFV